MRYLWLSVALLAAGGDGQFIYHLPPQGTITGGYYYTTFPTTENPISESGNWKNGAVDGRDWDNIQTSGGMAVGTEVNHNPDYDDSEAVLKGTWTSNQWAQARIFLQNQAVSGFQEAEIRLRRTLTTGVSQGYEVLFSCRSNNDYVQIAVWNGALNDFDTLQSLGITASLGRPMQSGDIITATAVGNVITGYINGVQVITVTDSTFSNGNPGIGFWLEGQTVAHVTDCGMTDFEAGDDTASVGFYSTPFEATENPISESSSWLNGAVDGSSWGNVRMTGGMAIGTTVSTGPPYDDSVALLKGHWAANQWAQAQVFSQNQNVTGTQEVELRLRSELSNGMSSGYEITFSCRTNTSDYVQINRWDGALNAFTQLQSLDLSSGALGRTLQSGDTITASIVGNVITGYVNGVSVVTATDSLYDIGQPGMGFWLQGQTSTQLGDCGLTDFEASDGQLRMTTGTVSDVNSKITAAASGDTVMIPAGSFTWASTVTVSGKALALRGATTCTGAASTLACTDRTTITVSTAILGLSVTGSTSNLARIGGLTIAASNCLANNGVINLSGALDQFSYHFHHSHVVLSGSCGDPGWIYLNKGWGLIDHVYIQNSANQHAFAVFGDWATSGLSMWQMTQTWGDARAAFIEDSRVENTNGTDGMMDGYAGGRVVVRYNALTFGSGTGNGSDTVAFHGFDSGSYRSFMTAEIYNNTYTNSSGFTLQGGRFRGGTALVHDNTFTGANGWNGISLQVFRTGNGCTATSYPACDGTQYRYTANGNQTVIGTGETSKFCAANPDVLCTADATCSALSGGDTCSLWVDGNGAGGYACRDQIGLTHNQASSPVYTWNNGSITAGAGCDTSYVQSGRDFINGSALPGYTAYTYPHPKQTGG